MQAIQFLSPSNNISDRCPRFLGQSERTMLHVLSFYIDDPSDDVLLLAGHREKRKDMKLFCCFLRSFGPPRAVPKHLPGPARAVYHDAVFEHQGSFTLKREGKIMSDSSAAAIQASVERLVLLSASQQLLDHAQGGYALYYANEPDEMPYQPEEVQMIFWRQTLYFQPGNREVQASRPYIDTALKMVAQDHEFGRYGLITSLDGTVEDDYIVWGEPLFYELPDDHAETNPIDPIDTSEGVPEHLRDLFPRLAHLSKQQGLLQRAERRCATWFEEHPLWFQQYPQSLVEEGTNPHRRWFQDHPTCFRDILQSRFPTAMRYA